MDVFATVIGGVLVFVFGQWVQRFVLEPVATFHEEVAHLSYTLLLHQAAITNTNANADIQNELKALGASIVSEAGRIPALRFLSRLKVFRLPLHKDIQISVRELNGIIHAQKSARKKGNDGIVVADALKVIGEKLRIDTKY